MRLPVLAYVLAGLTCLSAQGPGPSPIRYTEAREYNVRRQIRLPGSVQSPTVSTVAGKVEGLVVELGVREGDAVEKGQLLARLRTVNLELRRDASQSELSEAEARLKLAERNLERARELFDAKVFSQQELDDAFYEFSAWQGRLDRLRAEIERILDDIERCTIHAPFNGVVTDKHTELGQWLAVGDPVVELMAVDDLRVLVQVPERYYRGLRVGRRVSVEFEAIGGRKTVGTVECDHSASGPAGADLPRQVEVPESRRQGGGRHAGPGFVFRRRRLPRDHCAQRRCRQPKSAPSDLHHQRRWHGRSDSCTDRSRRRKLDRGQRQRPPGPARGDQGQRTAHAGASRAGRTDRVQAAMTIVSNAIRYPVTTAVGVILLTLFGGIALFRIPVQLTPTVEEPEVTVSTTWPGASPYEMERDIIDEQEEQLKSLEGLVEMESESGENRGSITMTFQVGADLDTAVLKVSNRLDQVPSYPDDADKPVIRTVDPRANASGWFILMPTETDGFEGDISTQHDFVKDFVKPELERVPGVAASSSFAGTRTGDASRRRPGQACRPQSDVQPIGGGA